MISPKSLIKRHDFMYEIPRTGHMRVPARIVASPSMIDAIFRDNAPEQAANVAWLPGIIGYSYAMPDIHWGYGFPIGGVAAFDPDEGVVSPGGVGYDINCGVRLMRTDLLQKDIAKHLEPLTNTLFKTIPSGVGSTGSVRLSNKDQKNVLREGARWAVEQGMGSSGDLTHIEESGCMPGADPTQVSERAMKRGQKQLGTLGSGNHFVEIGMVDKVFDPRIADRLGLEYGRITVTIHTGSRGFGHQVCDDFLKIMLRAVEKYRISIPDRQLCCAPISSQEGQAYLGAMACAVNFAFCNRQLISHRVRQAFSSVLGSSTHLDTVYEVAHNIAKMETHTLDGEQKRVCVHRKGATRAFAPHHPDIPAEYRDIGQPVLIPGDMGRYSFVLVGTERAMAETFGSTCHGAGRVLSRRQAVKQAKGRDIRKELASSGTVIRASSYGTLAEEMSGAYKDVADVVDSVVGAGLSKAVVRLAPLGVIKG